MKDNEQKIKAAAELLGPRNCEAVTGLPWRHVREHARALRVPVLMVGRKAAVPARAFLDAIERSSVRDSKPENGQVADPAEAVRSILRRAGAR